jgi:hypothetical protein
MTKDEWLERREMVIDCLDSMSSSYYKDKLIMIDDAEKLANLLKIGSPQQKDNTMHFCSIAQLTIAKYEMMFKD